MSRTVDGRGGGAFLCERCLPARPSEPDLRRLDAVRTASGLSSVPEELRVAACVSRKSGSGLYVVDNFVMVSWMWGGGRLDGLGRVERVLLLVGLVSRLSLEVHSVPVWLTSAMPSSLARGGQGGATGAPQAPVQAAGSRGDKGGENGWGCGVLSSSVVAGVVLTSGVTGKPLKRPFLTPIDKTRRQVSRGEGAVGSSPP